MMLISRVVGVILFFGAIIGALLPALYRGSGDEIYQYVLDTVPSLANDELIINKDPYDTRQDFIFYLFISDSICNIYIYLVGSF